MKNQNTRGPLAKRACDFCRVRKMKCDGLSKCGACEKRNHGNCTYNLPVQKRGPKKGSKRVHRVIGTFSLIEDEKNALKKEISDENKYYESLTLYTSEKELNIPIFEIINLFGPQAENINASKDIDIPKFNEINMSPNTLENTNMINYNPVNDLLCVNHSTGSNISTNALTNSPLSDSAPSRLHQPSNFDMFNIRDLQLVPHSCQANYISQLGLINDWPVSLNGEVDLVKLILYLNNAIIHTNNGKLTSTNIQSIVNYVSLYHNKMPLLDLNTFLSSLCHPCDSNIKALLNNLLVIFKLTKINYVKTMNCMYEAYKFTILNEIMIFEPMCQLNWILERVITNLAIYLV